MSHTLESCRLPAGSPPPAPFRGVDVGTLRADMRCNDRSTPVLPVRMRNLAATGHARAEELRQRANMLEDAAAGFFHPSAPTITAKEFLRAWSSARLLWCACSGEELLA